MPEIMVSPFVEKMRKAEWVEVKRWPMHYTDRMIIKEIEKDEKMAIYCVFGEGVPLFTFAGVKSFFAYVPSKPQRLFQSQVYSNKGRAKKHRPNRKN